MISGQWPDKEAYLIMAGSNVKSGEIVTWLKEDFHLGQGCAMAFCALLKCIKKKVINLNSKPW